MVAGFDPNFDDTQWTDDWAVMPTAEVPPGIYEDGYRIERLVLEGAEVFGRPYQLAAPLDCRLLYDPQGRLWMSTTPQERIMMYNNGRRSRGHVLVGGLGLGLYPQYAVRGAAGKATRFTAIEQSPAVRAMVEPTLQSALPVPIEVHTDSVEPLLYGPVSERYDTIFLDTWETLDAALLPRINDLRNQALRHLAPGGEVLLWGYGWMLGLFEDACRLLLAQAPGQRRSWLVQHSGGAATTTVLLAPVLAHFEGEVIEEFGPALAWCRHYATAASGMR